MPYEDGERVNPHPSFALTPTAAQFLRFCAGAALSTTPACRGVAVDLERRGADVCAGAAAALGTLGRAGLAPKVDPLLVDRPPELAWE